MQLPLVNLPQIAPQRPMRPTQDTVPPTREQREFIAREVELYVEKYKPVPPLSLGDLRVHAEAMLENTQSQDKFIDYIAILINNAAWKDQLAAVPYERRLLLLPKCLRDEEKCPAPFDPFGLLCKDCGLCSIQDLQAEAERLGYAVLTAEGSAIVMAIVETGKIDAIVGVSCLSVLERSFPYMEAAAIPGVAIPLLQDDCKDTNLDMDWLWEMIHLTSDDHSRRLDLDGIRDEVQSWFTQESMSELLGPANSHPEQLAREWLARDGKRWRPFLAVCVWKAAMLGTKHADDEIPTGLKKLAIAVECFHKASLIHDDIEDEDDVRYDEPTMHAEHGIAIALNVGDLMLGDGYRLIAESGAHPRALGKMLQVAAEGHRQLSIGQGQELKWLSQPTAISSMDVIDIFKRKTAPAFDVALQLGQLFAWDGDDENELDNVLDVLHEYSEALGIAYQIKDDVDDFEGSIDSNDAEAMRLSICLAIAHERAKKQEKELIANAWTKSGPLNGQAAQVKAVCSKLEVEKNAQHLHDIYREQAVRTLRVLENANLKGLLRRVVAKIFDEIKIESWCREHATGDATGREASAEPVA
jgi:geranylgeranyl diphosphate synthase, type II